MNEKIKKKSPAKVILIVCAIIVVLLIIADILVGNYLVSFAIGRSSASGAAVAPPSVTSDETNNIVDINAKAMSEKTSAWLEAAEVSEAFITSDDGLLLNGSIVRTPQKSDLWVIIIHGYTGRKEHMANYAAYYAERGFNVLLPDMRGHGESEGDYIGMGWLDRNDVLKWTDLIISEDPAAVITMHGVSMGGATVMMTSGENLPDNVKAIIDDCGYTSVWDIFSDELQYIFGLPAFPFLNTASVIAKIRAGYTFEEASALEQVKKAKVPMMFIHGSEDNFVHTEMAYRLHEVCPTDKELYVAEGAGHGGAVYVDPDAYFGKIFAFLEEQNIL
ncbi:MAG: alpha/beta fold hydrolase [Ruminiclostridium sp.]|nr:alpha/beta fold hydrolase [Ruminiclostridium sp.]